MFVDPEDGTVTRPIGFRGSFDGNGHTIRNLTITAREDQYGDLLPNGLFGALDASARIENLTLENVTIEGNNCIGGFVGRASGVLLRNLTFDGTITPTTGQSGYSVGGIIGCLSNNEIPTVIDDVEMTGQLTLPQGSTVGGLVGDMSMQEYDSLGATQTVTITNGAMSGTVQAGYEVSGAIGNLYMDGDELEVVVSDIEVTGTVDGVNSSYNGGIIGEASVNESSLIIQDVTVSGSVTGDDHTGGILGYISVNYGSVLLSNAVVTTPVTGEDFVGGVIGSVNHYADDASEAMTIQNVRVVGDVSGDGTVGGIIGYAYGYNDSDERVPLLNVYRASYVGDVTALNGYQAGGVVGTAYGTSVNQSFAVANVSTQDNEAGGLIGFAYNTTVLNSYARGSVFAENGYAGGLVGRFSQYVDVENSYATSAVASNSVPVGGLVGGEDVGSGYLYEVTNSYWDTQTSGQASSLYGTGFASLQMKSRPNFTGWNFAGVWGMNATVNDGYACLQWAAGCVNDGDEDGISGAVESAAPNGGDANQDGTLDGVQPNVASFENPLTGEYVVLAVDNQCSITEVGMSSEDAAAAKDETYVYQAGLMNFTLECGTPGYEATITKYYYGIASTTGLVIRKHNPVTGEYFSVPGANSPNLATMMIGGQPVVVASYTITDGDDLDTDAAVNGQIVDPIGLARPAVDAPDTGVVALPVTLFTVAGVLGAGLIITAAVLRRRDVLHGTSTH